MSVYLCYFLDGDGGVPMFDTLEAPSQAEALSRAERLLRWAPERAAVEVWEDGRRISTLMRTAGAV